MPRSSTTGNLIESAKGMIGNTHGYEPHPGQSSVGVLLPSAQRMVAATRPGLKRVTSGLAVAAQQEVADSQ